MRRETGEALLASSPQLRASSPALSSLVGRIAQSRGLTVAPTVTPPQQPGPAPTAFERRPALAAVPSRVAPGLVGAPPADRTVGISAHSVDGVALLGAHGGAGVTCLLRAGLDQVAVDAGRRWPSAGLVVLVARTSTSGLEWARDLARQHASGRAGDVELLGLVLVADAPRRLPARTAVLRDLVSGAFTRTWHLPWFEEWRLAATTEPLPAPPHVRHLSAELARARLADADPSCPTRTPRGDLL